MAWDAEHYLRYGDERTRPAVDLAARIPLGNPGTILDLGCGPGNSTQVLRRRWPAAEITGLDSSPEMIETARGRFPEGNWVLADMADYTAAQPFDLVFSNAALQWVPDHRELIPRLFSLAAAGGVFAFQIPCDRYAAVRRHIREISEDPAWCERMEGPRAMLTMEEAAVYYDALADSASRLDVWETEYFHVMNGTADIVDWISSTGMRPYLEALDSDADRERFTTMLRERVAESYPRRVDGKVLYPFRRLFVVAQR